MLPHDSLSDPPSRRERGSLSLGFSPMLPFFNGAYARTHAIGQQEIRDFYVPAYLPPRVSVILGFRHGPHIQSAVEGYWLGPQNSGFTVTERFWEGTMEVTLVDSFLMHTDVFGCRYDLRIIPGGGTRGIYVAGGAGYARATSKLFPTYTITTYDYDNELAATSSQRAKKGIMLLDVFSASCSAGYALALDDGTLLDFGLRTSFTLNRSRLPDPVPDYSYRDDIKAVASYVTDCNIQINNLLEFYVRIGFIK